jgi:hypothetical protein
VTPAEALHYALAADVDTLVVGFADLAQLALATAAAAAYEGLDPTARRALEARVASAAPQLTYYRADSLV